MGKTILTLISLWTLQCSATSYYYDEHNSYENEDVSIRCQFHQHFTRAFFPMKVDCTAFLYIQYRLALTFFAKEYLCQSWL
jgi:hypothetical protein